MTPQHILLSEYMMNFSEKTKGFHPQLKKNSTFNSIIIELEVFKMKLQYWQAK